MNVDYAALAPEIKLAAAACFVVVLDLGLRGRAHVVSGMVSLAAVVGAFVDVVALWGTTPRVTLSGMFVLDDFAVVLKGFFLVVGAIVLILSFDYMRERPYEGEYYFLVLSSILGTILMPSSRDLLMLFIALELVSVPAFIIAGIRKHDPRSNEASLKFFLFGVLSAGVFVYGISLVYGFAHTTSLEGIAARMTQEPEPLLLGAVVLIVAAFGFKVSAVPFHFWAPDTYEGSPPPLAAFLSVASKAAGFVGLVLILGVGFSALGASWGRVVAAISAATMTVGNLLALRQRHLVRLLAYSSIAQAGYMLIPVALVRPGNLEQVVPSLVLYLLIYAVMNLGAFAVAIGVSKQYPTLLIRDLSGLGRRAPLHASAMTAFLLALGGIPPFAGWAAKFFIFVSAVGVGTRTGIALAVIMVVNSVISLYYYVGVARVMYLRDPEEEGAVRFAPLVALTTFACLAGVLVLGVYPEPFIALGRAATIAVLR